MAAIQLLNVPAELHQELRHRAAAARMSLDQYVLDLLERETTRPTTRQWLDTLAQREPVAGVDVNATLDRARLSRFHSSTGRAPGGLRR